MALIKCNECGVDVSEQAAACPKCGNPIRGSMSAALSSPRSSTKRTLVGIALGLVIAVIAVAIFAEWLAGTTKTVNGASVPGTSDATALAQAATPELPPPVPPPVIQITAQQLYAEYDANEVLADTKYKGQWLDVRGVVTEIGKGFTDDPFVNLFGKDEFEVVHALFAKSAVQRLASLQKGDHVSLMCKDKGKWVVDVILDCTSDDTPSRSQNLRPTTVPEVPSSTPAAVTHATVDLAWLLGKMPSAVVNDPRFKAAFPDVPAQAWDEIADRLAVTDVNGIQLQAGYYFGSGCKAHFCNSDQAAFAVNAETGHGDLIYKSTDYTTGMAKAQGYAWNDLPISATPLAAWAKSNGMNVDAAPTASTNSPQTDTFRTSFDCSKARSDAEHLVCNDAELAADDVELAAVYARAKAVAPDQAAFKEHVRQQWNYRERACHDRGCVAQWYANQKQWFTNIIDGQAGGVSQPQASQPPSAPTYQTSFDCSAPTFLDEQAICHDRGLAAMDLEMAHDYAAAVQRGSPDKLADGQHDWMAQRRDCAGDLNCLRHAYGVRIDQLQRWRG